MLDKKIIKENLLNTINDFYKLCKLPPMHVTNRDWDILLNVLEKHFNAKNIINDYEHALNIIIRRALDFAQTNHADSFNINHLIKAIDDLCAFNIYTEERSRIKEEIKSAYMVYYGSITIDDEKEELRNLIKNIIDEECKKCNTNAPNNITEEEWFKAFDVIKAHYLANNIMSQYRPDLMQYVIDVIYWSQKDKYNVNELLAGYALDALSHINNDDELGSIALEIDERINGNNKNKTYIKNKQTI